MKLKFNIGLKFLALFEAAKGMLVLLVGAGLLTLIHRNVQNEGADIVQFFHLNPAWHYPEIFLKTLSNINSANLWFLSVSAILYVIIRMAEAYGLWHDRAWAIWFAVASSALFLPIELFELYKRITIPRFLVLLLNIALILYLSRHIKQSRSQK
jgi:Predicted membrane protein